jgi:pimeloyl-ACP methyl ester carboxylesterase
MRLERPTEVAHLEAGPVEYRLEPHGKETVVVFHGGHLRAGLPLGEDVFAEGGYSILALSRPGYGRTPLHSGTSPAEFADVTAALCDHLGIDHIAAVVGVSAGGRTAVATAARHPQRVSRLILESAVGFLPWPDRRTRAAANVVFTARTEKATWAMVRLLLRFAPAMGLRLLMGDLTTKRTSEVLASLSDDEHSTLVALYSHMRSGAGFLNDLRGFGAVPPEPISQPTLVIASRNDAAVPIAHAESLVRAIPHAELVVSQADSHLVWFGNDYPVIAEKIQSFLTADQPRS